MAYTPINWDEDTPITPDNLNKMDNQIDDNDGRITTNDGRVTTNEGDISSIKKLDEYSIGSRQYIEAIEGENTDFNPVGLYFIEIDRSTLLRVWGETVANTDDDSISGAFVFSTGNNVIIRNNGGNATRDNYYRKIELS